MLFFEEDSKIDTCMFCGLSRWKMQRSQQKKQNSLPYARIHYLPLKPRLWGLYASRFTTEHKRQNYRYRHEDSVFCHPSDATTWKHFDNKYPNFATKPRNISLGLYADRFNPYTLSSRSYSVWLHLITFSLKCICPHHLCSLLV